jgi:hypothetical protein
MLRPSDVKEAERIFSALAEGRHCAHTDCGDFPGAAVRQGRRSIPDAVVDQLLETHGLKNTETGKQRLAIKARTA